MIKNPIYVPKGKAKEYGGLALNIYRGCTNGCEYCYAPKMLRMIPPAFHAEAIPRVEIVESVKKTLEKGYVRHKEGDISEKVELNGKLIHLCFTCDPYPAGVDTTATREIINLIKESGNHVQILTKSGEAATRDFDLLDENDWFGITFTGYSSQAFEPEAASAEERIATLEKAKEAGLNTWVSCEPVINQNDIEKLIRTHHKVIDKIKIGKPNYVEGEIICEKQSPIPWGEWGKHIEAVCREVGIDYYIKDGLREDIDKYGNQ